MPSRSQVRHAVRQCRQKGNSLIVVLVILTLMALAGFGAMRTVDTGNVISGNFAFQQAATLSSDRAMDGALDYLASLANRNNDVANRYSAIRLGGLDARGVPAAVNWTNVPCTSELGVVLGDCVTDSGNYRVQYFIERLCSVAPNMADISDIRSKCEYEPNATATAPGSIALRYRIIIRVRGPRQTEGWYEAMVSGPAT